MLCKFHYHFFCIQIDFALGILIGLGIMFYLFFLILIFFAVSTNLLPHLDPCLSFLLPMGITNNVLHMYFTQYKSSVLNKYLKYISYIMNEYWVHWTLLSHLYHMQIHSLYLKDRNIKVHRMIFEIRSNGEFKLHFATKK